jgi:hypothetical protein
MDFWLSCSSPLLFCVFAAKTTYSRHYIY